MKLKTAGVCLVSIIVLSGGYQVAQTVSRERTSATMPKAKNYPANPDGRVYAVVQLCWEPGQVLGAPHVVIGPLDRGETNVKAPRCASPWTRRGLVSVGDRVAVAWVMNAETPARVIRWRITIAGVERMGGNDKRQHALNACIVGTPPC